MARVGWVPPAHTLESAFRLGGAELSAFQLGPAAASPERVVGAPAFVLAPPGGIQSTYRVEIGSAATCAVEAPKQQKVGIEDDVESSPEAAVVTSSGGEEESSAEKNSSAVESSREVGGRSER